MVAPTINNSSKRSQLHNDKNCSKYTFVFRYILQFSFHFIICPVAAFPSVLTEQKMVPNSILPMTFPSSKVAIKFLRFLSYFSHLEISRGKRHFARIITIHIYEGRSSISVSQLSADCPARRRKLSHGEVVADDEIKGKMYFLAHVYIKYIKISILIFFRDVSLLRKKEINEVNFFKLFRTNERV